MKPSVGDVIEITPSSFGVDGEAVGHFDGFTIFVEGALPGELVKATVSLVKKNYAKAVLLEVVRPSSYRVNPICPAFGKCGGCQLMHLSYPQQLVVKRQRIVDALERIGRLHGTVVEACVPSPNPLAYRNKIQLPVVNSNGLKGVDDNPLRIGLYAHHTHDVIAIDHCYIHCDIGEEAFRSVRAILNEGAVLAYDPLRHKGALRNILIKSAVNNREVLIVLVTTGEEKELLKKVANRILKETPLVKGVVENINRRHDNVILGEEYRTLAGVGHIYERIFGMMFKVSPASFFQVNPLQAEQLYEKVVTFADVDGTKSVLDAYCGVGTLSLILAAKAKKVVGIECVPQAIADANENARSNHVFNCQFLCGKTEVLINGMKGVDIAIINPPRKGCEVSAIEAIGRMKPKRLVYVSCDPATLARDLALLVGYGFRIDVAQPFDMFPQTMHVETVVKLSYE